MPPVFDIIQDIVQIPHILMVVRNGIAVSEVRSHGLPVSQRNDWITIGDNDGPAHMHLNHTMIHSIQFVRTKKTDRTSYSVQFLDNKGERILAAFFTKMYDDKMHIIQDRLELYHTLEKKWGQTP